MGEIVRRAFPTDVSDEEWAFVLPYLLMSREYSRSRQHSLREPFNGVPLHREDGQSVTIHAARPAALERGVSADAALGAGWVAGDRCAGVVALLRWAQGPANGGYSRMNANLSVV